jgi:hypothetical protein
MMIKHDNIDKPMSLTANQLDFITFCIEMYAAEKGMSGQNVFRQFDRCGVLEYLSENYEVLHTQKNNHIVSIVDEWKRKSPMNQDEPIDPKLFRLLIHHKAAAAAVLLAKSEHFPLLDALRKFYLSQTYQQLEDEETKTCWESPAQIYADYLT